jgi:hypothetical protein
MSAILNWSDAVQMLNAYQNNSKALQKNPPRGTEILKGFKIDRAEIELIMNNSNVQDVLIMPAVNLSDVPKPENEQAFTMIVAGTDSNGNIVENAVVDFTIPCPANCPDNYPNV